MRTNTSLAIGYVRASTSKQTLSPSAQRTALEEWCDARGVTLVSTHEDFAIKGSVPLDKRPGLAAALASVREHRAGFLVCARRDRIARDVLICGAVEAACKKAGSRLVSAAGEGSEGTGPEAQFLRQILDCVAALERSTIAARTRAALAVKRDRGEHTGGPPPFGFRVGPAGILERDRREQGVIARVRGLRVGGMSLRGIVTELEYRRIRSRTGRGWHLEQVCRMLRSSRPVVA